MSSSPHVVGPPALKGLAHPLRLKLLAELNARGSATASQLGTALGESSGSTSYHLRQLHRHGFVEEDVEQGTGRERVWIPRRAVVRDAARWSTACSRPSKRPTVEHADRGQAAAGSVVLEAVHLEQHVE